MDRYQIVPAEIRTRSRTELADHSHSMRLITLTFDGRMIMDQSHPALHRLIGAKIVTS